MTLSTDTAALLRCGIDALLQLTGSAPYALLGPDERKSALHHLTVTAEAAAKLAEVAHVDALRAQHAVLPGPARGGNTEEPITTEATATGCSGGGEEVLVQTLGAGLEKSKTEKQMAETETLVPGVEITAAEIERLVGEKERVEAEAERLKGELDRWRISRSIAEEKRECIRKAVAETSKELKAMANGRGTVTDIDRLIEYLPSLGSRGSRLQLAEESTQIAESEVNSKLERSVQETEGLKVELMTARTSMAVVRDNIHLVSRELGETSEKLKTQENGGGAEIDSLIRSLYLLGDSDGRVLIERDNAKKEVAKLSEDLERSVAEQSRLQEDLNRLRSENAKIEGDIEGPGAGGGAGGGAGPVKKGQRRGW